MPMKDRIVTSALSMLLVSPAIARATPILVDQQMIAGGGGVGAPVLAQTFTVGIAGNLVGVDIAASAPPSTTLYILGTTGGVPDLSQQLRAVALPVLPHLSTAPYFQPTIFFAPLSVNVGDVLAIVISVPGNSVGWHHVAVAYSGGGAFQGFQDNSGAILNQFRDLRDPRDPGLNFGFRTYVDTGVGNPAPVPEPTSLILLGSGLILVVRRRMRHPLV